MKNNKEDLRSLRSRLDSATKELRFENGSGQGQGDLQVPESLRARAQTLSEYVYSRALVLCAHAY